MTEKEKMYQAIYKALGEGMAKFLKHSLAYFTLICVCGGLSYALYLVDRHHDEERRLLKAEIKEYADSLKTANRLLIEAQADKIVCTRELNRLAAQVTELRAEIRLLKQSKR